MKIERERITKALENTVYDPFRVKLNKIASLLNEIEDILYGDDLLVEIINHVVTEDPNDIDEIVCLQSLKDDIMPLLERQYGNGELIYERKDTTRKETEQ